MATDDQTFDIENNDNKWTCRHCYKTYSKHYKYKTHLKKCLVYQQRCKMERDVLLDLKNEIKSECLNMFQSMMCELKNNILSHKKYESQPSKKPPFQFQIM